MIFKKPYAFFIKYFRLINLILSLLIIFLCYKLNILRVVLNNIYLGRINDYNSLKSTYIGLSMYFTIFLIIVILFGIIALFYKKKKPLYDYLFNVIYLIFVFVYLMSTGSMFLTLEKIVVEQTTLKLYADISFIIILPALYFLIKYVLIVIGFSLGKFNFTKDLIELKQDEKDNEEVELIFDKNVYKYKRGIRKTLRELRYYFLENKFFISIIGLVVVVFLFVFFLGMIVFKSNRVSVGKNFVAGGFTYKVNSVYESKYALDNSVVEDGYKFVIINANVRNNSSESTSVDFKSIRLVYKKDYSYASNYYNKFFVDLGTPYNEQPLLSGVSNNYIFIFKVPSSYKSNKYYLKFYDKVEYVKNEIKGTYKELSVKSNKIDKKQIFNNCNLNEFNTIDKKSYGNTKVSISGYDIKSTYIYEESGINKLIKDKDINKVLLIIDYKLEIDSSVNTLNYFKTNKDFFNKFSTITYTYNDSEKQINNVTSLGDVNGKILLSVPYEIMNAQSISLNLEFRNVKMVFKLK